MTPQNVPSADQPNAADTPLQIVYVPVLIATPSDYSSQSTHPSQQGQPIAAWPLSTTVSPAVAQRKENAMSKRVSVKGLGQELLGQGVDLLFGEEPTNGAPPAATDVAAAAGRATALAADAPDAALGSPDLELEVPPLPSEPGGATSGEAALEEGVPPLATSPMGGTTGSATATPSSNATPLPTLDESPALPTLDVPAAGPIAPAPTAPGEATPTPPTAPHPTQPPSTEAPPMPEPPASLPAVAPTNGSTSPAGTAPAKPPAEPRKVGPPGVTVGGPVVTALGTPAAPGVSEEERILGRPKETISEAEAEEILKRVRQRDLEKLDREIDRLYERSVEVLSGEDEANVAFEALRKARHMLLLEPEQIAEVEYLVNQIRAMLTRVEHAQSWGAHYGPRLLGYFLGWLVALGIFAVVTIVPNTGFSNWVALLLRTEPAAAALAVILISTLAWGGIGGATGGLWSLHYHVSVRRDFDKNEMLWYLEQPILGMVLGGIVYLIMAAGFLVVQVDLATPEATLGAKLLPATLAVVAGFRQNLVLDLIDRIVNLLVPRPESPRSRDAG